MLKLPKVGVPVALDTVPYLKKRNLSLSEVATRDFLSSKADARFNLMVSFVCRCLPGLAL